MRNWMECLLSRKQPNAPIEAGYNHSVASLMVTQALHTGKRVVFNEKNKKIVEG